MKELVVIVEGNDRIESEIDRVQQYIHGELNVKRIKLTKEKAEYGIEMKAKANFPVLALKAKEKMKVLSGLIEKMSDADVSSLRSTGAFVLDGVALALDDVKLLPKINAQFSQYETDFDENVCVLMDVSPDQEMINEGVLREVVNRVQRLRKEYKIVPLDDIVVYYDAQPATSNLAALLAKSVEFVEGNIRKPFKQYESSLSLAVKPKDFEVRKHVFFFIRFILF
jgi:isoleucyl-tRNA synthetase